jgi:hypothetical protein
VRAAAAVSMAQGRRASVMVLLRATGTGWGGVEVQDYVPLGARRWMLVRGRQPRSPPRQKMGGMHQSGCSLGDLIIQVHIPSLSVTSSSTTEEISTAPPWATFM